MATSKAAGIPATAKEPEIIIKPCSYIPAMAYSGDPAVPGYWLDEIRPLLHVDDFRELMTHAELFIDEGGRQKMWALDYIKWLNAPHEE